MRTHHYMQPLTNRNPTNNVCCPCSATRLPACIHTPTATMIAGAAAAWLLCKSALAAAAGSTAAAAMLAACLVASYIGGSVNFIAVAAATQLPTGLVPGAMAADNLGMLLLLGLMMAVPLRFLQQQQQQQQLQQVMVPVLAAGGAALGRSTSTAFTSSSGVSSRSRSAAASSQHTSSSGSSSGSSSDSSSDDDLLALDGSPLLTQPPTELEVSACLEDTSHGTNFTRVLPVDVSGGRKKKSSSSSGSDTGSSSDDDLLALDGSPLPTQPPTEVEVQAVLQDNSTGHNFTRVLPINVSGSKRPVSSSKSNSSSSNTAQQPRTSGAQAAATPGGSSAAAATGTCGGCRGSGVTAFDDKPLLTRAPGMGDAVSSIAAARQGKQQLMTPPKPPSAAMYTSKQPHSTAGSSQGYNSERGPDGLIVGCGCCSEALDAIAAASPPLAALLGSSGSSSGSSSDDDMIALDGSPLLTSPPSELEVAACLEATSHGDNQTRVLPVNLSGSKGSSSNGSSSSNSSSSTPATGSIGALALDGSLLLTEEPESNGLAAAVAAARSGGSIGSSVSVSPLMTGEFELLVTLDKDSLLQRLRHQKKKQKKQQLKARRDAEAVTVTVAAAAHASAAAAAASSSSKAHAAGQGDRTLPVAAHSSSQDAPALAVSASSARSELTASTAAAAVAAAAVAAAAAHQIATALQNPALHQLLLAALAVSISAAATAVHKLLGGSQGTQSPSPAAAGPGPFAGAGQLGQVLIGVFFAALGASCCSPLSTLACCLPLLAFISVMTATHWALLWGLGGRLLGLKPEVLICGSAAAIGGPATAAGLANARGWDQLVQPSLLCGSLGYALGTGAGLLVAHALGVLP